MDYDTASEAVVLSQASKDLEIPYAWLNTVQGERYYVVKDTT